MKILEEYCNDEQGVYMEDRDLDKNPRWLYRFRKHINMIRNGEIRSREDLERVFFDYWLNAYTYEQDRNQPPALKQSRNYSFGNDIWGVIHDVFGKEKVYEVFRNPDIFPEVYNDAVIKIGKEKYVI